MNFRIFLSIAVIAVEADLHDQAFGGHRFLRGGKIVAEFSNCIGWIELPEEPKDKASVTTLTIVPSIPPDAA